MAPRKPFRHPARSPAVNSKMVEVLQLAGQPAELLKELRPMKHWDQQKQALIDKKGLMLRGDCVYGYYEGDNFKTLKHIRAEGKNPAVNLYYEGKMGNVRLAAVMGATFLNCNEEDVIVHLDGDATNCNITNLCKSTEKGLQGAFLKWLQARHPQEEFRLLRWRHAKPFYIASDPGFVYSTVTMDKMAMCRNGRYLTIPIFYDDGTNEMIGVHRLIYSTFHGDVDPENQVDHKNHDTHDNSKGNLRQLPAQENRYRRRSPSAAPSNREVKSLKGVPHALEASASSWMRIGPMPRADYSKYEMSVYSNVRLIGSSELLSRSDRNFDNPYDTYNLKNELTGRYQNVPAHRLMAATYQLPIGIRWTQSFSPNFKSETTSATRTPVTNATPTSPSSPPAPATPTIQAPLTFFWSKQKQPTTDPESITEPELITDLELITDPELMMDNDMLNSPTPLETPELEHDLTIDEQEDLMLAPRPQTRFAELAEQYVIDHIDRNTHNNCLSNLRWLTQRENVAAALGVAVRIVDTTSGEWRDYTTRIEAAQSLGFQNGHKQLDSSKKPEEACYQCEWMGTVRRHVAILLLDAQRQPIFTGDPATIPPPKGRVYLEQGVVDKAHKMYHYFDNHLRKDIGIPKGTALPVVDETKRVITKKNRIISLTRLNVMLISLMDECNG